MVLLFFPKEKCKPSGKPAGPPAANAEFMENSNFTHLTHLTVYDERFAPARKKQKLEVELLDYGKHSCLGYFQISTHIFGIYEKCGLTDRLFNKSCPSKCGASPAPEAFKISICYLLQTRIL